jgi:hypothetical protein
MNNQIQEGKREYKLRCFSCNAKFKNRNRVFRNSEGFPLCEDCLAEELDHYWLEAWELVKEINCKEFKRDYRKWKNWHDETYVECDGEHKEYGVYYIHKDYCYKYNGKVYCEGCAEDLGLLD